MCKPGCVFSFNLDDVFTDSLAVPVRFRNKLDLFKSIIMAYSSVITNYSFDLIRLNYDDAIIIIRRVRYFSPYAFEFDFTCK